MKRLDYLDGLKGWCAISISILHFLMMFLPEGYIGWRCLPEGAQQPFSYYFQWFPYSVVINNSFPLYIFFAITAFISCHLFLQNREEDKLKRKILLRYFRFLPLVAISCTAAYLLLRFELCPLQAFYDITGNTWGYARLEESYTLLDAWKAGFFTAYWEGTQLVSPLWCLHHIFWGSMMSLLVLLFYNRLRNKAVFFAGLILFSLFTDQTYLSFLVGILAAVIVHTGYTPSSKTGALLVAAGCVWGLFPPVLLPDFLNIIVFYAIGAGFILVGTHCCFGHLRPLCNRFTVFLGQESLAAIIWQFLVLQSLNVFLYNTFYRIGMGEFCNIAINFVINTAVSLLLTWVSAKTITPLTNRLCRWVDCVLWKSHATV